VLGFVYTGSNLGGTLVPLVATAVATRPGGSWRDALVVIAGLALVLILPFTTLAVREPPPGWRPEPDPRTPGATLDEGALDLRAAARTRSFWLLFASLTCFYFYYLGVNQHLAAHLSDIGYSDGRAAAGFAGAVFVGIAGKLSIGWLADRIAHRRALLANFVLLLVASALLLAADRPALLLLFLVAHGFAVAAENVLLPLLVADCFGLRHMARIYGVLMLSLFVGGGLGPIFAGDVFDRTGDYAPAFLTYVALNGLTVLLLAGVRDERASAPAGGSGRLAPQSP
jgi:cyanate permease